MSSDNSIITLYVIFGMSKKEIKIIFTGGGSGGHTFPAVSIIDALVSHNYLKLDEIAYLGSKRGIEAQVIAEKGIDYNSIPTGKLIRKFSFRLFIEFIHFLRGVVVAYKIIWKKYPQSQIIFSTGGFVSLPVVLAASLKKKKIFVHEQTAVLGLANRIAIFFCHFFFYSFESTKNYLKDNRKTTSIHSGYPIRENFLNKKLYPVIKNKFKINKSSINTKPVLLVLGGGNGSQLINRLMANNLAALKEHFQIVHQVGNKFKKEYAVNDNQIIEKEKDYYIFSFSQELPRLLKEADICLARSGAGTVWEMIALKKKVLFIPLAIAQKNEQYHNAQNALKYLTGSIIEERQIASITLVDELLKIINKKSNNRLAAFPQASKIICQKIIQEMN